jgi:hypothetical protein
MPKYTRFPYEGALVREYYASAKDHDIIFIGDCEVYSNISPVTLWEEFGFTSYIRGSAQQLVWHSYYMLEDTLRRETPQAVVFNVMAMQYAAPQNEAYNRMTLDGMRLSYTKIKAVRASRMAHENPLSYIFPILRYNERWSELSFDDVRYLFRKPPVSVNGFMVRSDVKPMGFIPEGLPRPSYQFAEVCYDYLNKITRLCEKNGIPLVLIKAPVMYPWWYPQWDAQMAAYAGENGLLYINLLDYVDEIGLDFSADTFNAGLHLNVYGAEKLARYLGGILRDEYALQNRQGEAETAARWREKSEAYRRLIARQQTEMEEHGIILTFLP